MAGQCKRSCKALLARLGKTLVSVCRMINLYSVEFLNYSSITKNQHILNQDSVLAGENAEVGWPEATHNSQYKIQDNTVQYNTIQYKESIKP